jgi:hypothetical protein
VSKEVRRTCAALPKLTHEEVSSKLFGVFLSKFVWPMRTAEWKLASTSSHKWETYRRRRFGRFSRRRATSILRSVRKERATQKIGQSAIGPPGWLEKGPSASLLVRHVSQRIRSSLAPSIQTLLKPTVCLPLMRRCTSAPARI